MSAKWRQNLAWDDQFFPSWAWPAKFLLRAFSSIWLAVLLLAIVGAFGILASVPIGMIALLPTVLLYAALFIGAIVLGAALPSWFTWRALAGLPRAGRFVTVFALFLALAAAASWAWIAYAWPLLKWDPAHASGVRFFASFVEANKAITLRRLPGMEMSELEFYAWWPLRLVLLMFVLNMIIATVRRIDFTLPKLGVLMVHTGIVTIALGSVYYSALKQEGDMLLLSGPLDAEGKPTIGEVETGFYENAQSGPPVLAINQGRGIEMRPLIGLPRYNDYGLGTLGTSPGDDLVGLPDGGRTLDLRVGQGLGRGVDGDLSFRVVGYASYAELVPRWRPVDGPGVAADGASVPLRMIELHSALPDKPGGASGPERVDNIPLLPTRPAERMANIGNFVALEHTRGMDAGRWESLKVPMEGGSEHALVVEVPGKKYRGVFAIKPGQTIEAAGYALVVKAIEPRPPLQIITKGYEGATSSVAIVHVTPPKESASPLEFDRYVYHRFPEINQDLTSELNERGMPKRRDAEASIRMWYVDASVVQVYFDEMVTPAGGAAETAGVASPLGVRAIVRMPNGTVQVFESLATGESIPFGPLVSLKLGQRWANAERVEVPLSVPEAERDRDGIGSHLHAAIAVEVAMADSTKPSAIPAWTSTVWVPFAQFPSAGQESVRVVDVPGGGGAGAAGGTRQVRLSFTRRWRSFPDLAVRLADFEMTPYPHSTQPQDFRSVVEITRRWSTTSPSVERAHTSLNDPLLVRVPFEWSRERPAAANAIGWLVSWIAPTQYKFAQAGWDQRGWTQTKAAAEAGQLPRAFANFTILGVGNNPGIYVIAAGAVMMSLGIPYAFYLKPYILRRRKEAIQRAIAAGTYVRPARGAGDDDEAAGGAHAGGGANGAAKVVVVSAGARAGRAGGGGS